MKKVTVTYPTPHETMANVPSWCPAFLFKWLIELVICHMVKVTLLVEDVQVEDHD